MTKRSVLQQQAKKDTSHLGKSPEEIEGALDINELRKMIDHATLDADPAIPESPPSTRSLASREYKDEFRETDPDLPDPLSDQLINLGLVEPETSSVLDDPENFVNADIQTGIQERQDQQAVGDRRTDIFDTQEFLQPLDQPWPDGQGGFYSQEQKVAIAKDRLERTKYSKAPGVAATDPKELEAAYPDRLDSTARGAVEKTGFELAESMEHTRLPKHGNQTSGLIQTFNSGHNSVIEYSKSLVPATIGLLPVALTKHTANDPDEDLKFQELIDMLSGAGVQEPSVSYDPDGGIEVGAFTKLLEQEVLRRAGTIKQGEFGAEALQTLIDAGYYTIAPGESRVGETFNKIVATPKGLDLWEKAQLYADLQSPSKDNLSSPIPDNSDRSARDPSDLDRRGDDFGRLGGVAKEQAEVAAIKGNMATVTDPDNADFLEVMATIAVDHLNDTQQGENILGPIGDAAVNVTNLDSSNSSNPLQATETKITNLTTILAAHRERLSTNAVKYGRSVVDALFGRYYERAWDKNPSYTPNRALNAPAVRATLTKSEFDFTNPDFVISKDDVTAFNLRRLQVHDPRKSGGYQGKQAEMSFLAGLVHILVPNGRTIPWDNKFEPSNLNSTKLQEWASIGRDILEFNDSVLANIDNRASNPRQEVSLLDGIDPLVVDRVASLFSYKDAHKDFGQVLGAYVAAAEYMSFILPDSNINTFSPLFTVDQDQSSAGRMYLGMDVGRKEMAIATGLIWEAYSDPNNPSVAPNGNPRDLYLEAVLRATPLDVKRELDPPFVEKFPIFVDVLSEYNEQTNSLPDLFGKVALMVTDYGSDRRNQSTATGKFLTKVPGIKETLQERLDLSEADVTKFVNQVHSWALGRVTDPFQSKAPKKLAEALQLFGVGISIPGLYEGQEIPFGTVGQRQARDADGNPVTLTVSDADGNEIDTTIPITESFTDYWSKGPIKVDADGNPYRQHVGAQLQNSGPPLLGHSREAWGITETILGVNKGRDVPLYAETEHDYVKSGWDTWPIYGNELNNKAIDKVLEYQAPEKYFEGFQKGLKRATEGLKNGSIIPDIGKEGQMRQFMHTLAHYQGIVNDPEAANANGEYVNELKKFLSSVERNTGWNPSMVDLDKAPDSLIVKPDALLDIWTQWFKLNNVQRDTYRWLNENKDASKRLKAEVKSQRDKSNLK